MEIFVVALVAFAASMLTFFSGFGLGTLLTPVFLIFFPLPIAILMTAVVHFLNNLFKMGMLYKFVEWKTLLNFGLAAVLGVIPGVYLLKLLDNSSIIFSYSLMSKNYDVSYMGVVVGILMIIFALAEFKKSEDKISKNKMRLGGFVSGFFGGLSGHQGALRSAVLIRLNLRKEQFVATGVAISLFVDITRIPLYFNNWIGEFSIQQYYLLTIAVLSAFIGAWIGRKFLKKISIQLIRQIIGVFLILLGLLLMMGIVN